MKYIVDGEIDVKFIMDTLADGSPDSGSLIMFEGRVRADEVGGNFVEKIFYESYISMAEKEIEKIEDEVIKKFGVKRVVIKHRIGEVKVGEVALFVAVLSAHRTEGFEAIQYAINEVKKRVPIWKREILSNGKTRWREND
ncbi:molybdopterin synthase subunit MoaE [Candidatus Kryptonium thompsonii]|uniref:Molybdopterin synthase catalytic subunit n=1 Tax=Candidatus Kryptonium thompsonii TaxID=1633631 RepID=A0A0P1MAA7_9BACT|nr:molybdenum cofactor biosynthesis protein MoaE [Candidatus Kryptonium thompsoni]CUS76854.1 molybdopterin synthase catalytic subunit [Candidatus Kryptonium thompsoni]CUS77010.1 molybdopterin synthase subunit MoaE [Candidatus Kryptonium thompsoni]CUS80048.1 molybdopterin synthase subunit MoaE [Candidatus Kryptonium thompsoni]CUS80559.1 molybdopterin synthase subunit MoaE [Candidatus Kryptonium thompsoni]CUS85012.1 molybdopterin synthase catalytic subunit [Candidatus Kryptonium thompsoni]